jgi:hypothetical protein
MTARTIIIAGGFIFDPERDMSPLNNQKSINHVAGGGIVNLITGTSYAQSPSGPMSSFGTTDSNRRMVGKFYKFEYTRIRITDARGLSVIYPITEIGHAVLRLVSNNNGSNYELFCVQTKQDFFGTQKNSDIPSHRALTRLNGKDENVISLGVGNEMIKMRNYDNAMSSTIEDLGFLIDAIKDPSVTSFGSFKAKILLMVQKSTGFY